MKILIVEDEFALADALRDRLMQEKNEVDIANDGTPGYDMCMTGAYDIIILDGMLPGKDGIEIIYEMRKAGVTTPVLMLTARSDLMDKLKGLDAGADDYMTKPFEVEELLARLRAMIRTDNSAPRIKELSYCDIKLDSEDFSMSATNSVRLSPKEFELMRELIAADGEGLDSATIAERLWKEDECAGDQSVFLYISYLRAKLESISSNVTIEGEEGGRYTLKNAEM